MTLEILKNGQQKYVQTLINREISENTIRKYSLAIRTFIHFAETTDHCTEICKNCLIDYKNYLQQRYKPNTSNLYIVALNGYLHYLGDDDLRIKSLKIQNQNILENCFTIDEYKLMLEVAKKQKDNTAYYVMRTLANTGMRIRGLAYLTVDIIKKGSFTITSKGKTRCIVIPKGICNELIEFCNTKDITEGRVFKGHNPNKPISQSSIRRWIKKIAILAGIDEHKAFPHNLRHLFAMTFIEKYGNLSELADILGHTRIETTRIYTRTGIEEKRKKIENIGL